MQPSKIQVVVFRQPPDKLEPEILLLEKSVNGHSSWNLITGHIEAGESPNEAAEREIIEETGLESLGKLLSLPNEVTFTSRFSGKQEYEVAFAIESTNLAEEVDLSSNPDHEHIGFRWVEAEEAHLLAPWESFKESIQSLLHILQS